MTSKKILVIGGGFAGIGSIKALKEEGLDPICYEKTSRPGGTWNYRQETPFGIPSIMPTTVINHSKEMGTFSNYIPNPKFPNYMGHEDLYKCMTDIGKKFDCFKQITYNREVLKVKRSADYEETGRWDIEVQNTETGEIYHETYDGVMVCVGQFTFPKMASYPGMEKFKGIIKHSHDLKEVDEYKNKNAVVVGMGCSGLDAAVELSNVASQVYLSTRSGSWVLPRVGPYGLPLDLFFLRRWITNIQDILGWKVFSCIFEKFFLNVKFNHHLYNIKPKYSFMSKDPVMNDTLPTKIITGAIKVKRDVKCFTENGIIFEDETKVTEADVVIMATGYAWKFDFLEDGIVKLEDNKINLYKCMYPAHLKHPSLVIIGFFLPFGPGFPLGEIQTRWAAQVFNGKFLPPSEEEMMADIQKRYEINSKRYVPSDKISIRIDFIQYMDEIASMFGTKPNMWKLLFTDPKLYWALFFGPSLPYQYRLQGPHRWDGARDAILTAYDRVCSPFSDEENTEREKPRSKCD